MKSHGTHRHMKAKTFAQVLYGLYTSNCKQCGVLSMFDFLPSWSILVRIFSVCLECIVCCFRDRTIQNAMLGCVKVSRTMCMRVRLILLACSELLQPRQCRRFAAFGRCLKIWHGTGILSLALQQLNSSLSS